MILEHPECPKCGKEMEAGWVYRPGGTWVAEKPDFRRSLTSFLMNWQVNSMSVYPRDGEHSRRAWRCSECDLLLTHTTSTEEPEPEPWTPRRIAVASLVVGLSIAALAFAFYYALRP